MSEIKVDFAVFGVLKGGNENNGLAIDVKTKLQQLIDQNKGIVTIESSYLGAHNSLGKTNRLGAQIQRAGGTYHFACQEGQTINFEQGGHALK